jgi:hypothetical protein
MNRDDIISMAREAGFSTLLPSEHVNGAGGVYCGDDEISEMLERFAKLVAAAEREACAKVCEGSDAAWTETAWNDACHTCAAAIRARGKE